MNPSVETARRRWALSVTTADGGEVSISLHPVSLARLLAEVIEDAAHGWCKRRGHAPGGKGYCLHCGTHLPDDGPYKAWLPDAYRTIRKPSSPPDEPHPCDNYQAPFTCLTAPSSTTARCDQCKEA